MKPHPESIQDAVAHAPGDAHDVGGARAFVGHDRQRVARRDSRRPVRVAPREPGALDEPRGRELDALAPGSGHRGMAVSPAAAATRSASAAGITGLTKNDPQLRRFGSAASRTMDFARRTASTLSRTSTRVGCSIARAVSVARAPHSGSRRPPRPETVGHGEDHMTVGRPALERAVAVAEPGNVTCFNSLEMSHSFFSFFRHKPVVEAVGTVENSSRLFGDEFSKRLWESGKTCSSFFHFSIRAAVSIAFPFEQRSSE